jgi:hypothetical protein
MRRAHENRRSRSLAAASAAGLAIALLTPGVAHAQPRVAIVAAQTTEFPPAFQLVDVQQRLQATGQFAAVDIINTVPSTPTLAQLAQYNSVIVWTNSTPANANTWGDVMADYVDAGGGVVVAVFANTSTTTARRLQGRWLTGGYEIIPSARGTTTGGALLGAVLQPAHPIMQGVQTFDGGSSSFRPTAEEVCATCTKVALWTDGKTLVAVHDTRPRRADLGFYPVPAGSSSGGWNFFTDGALIMANALTFVAGTVTTCRADFNSDGELTFDDITIFIGAYNAGENRADLNRDGEWTFDDITLFVGLYNAGC